MNVSEPANCTQPGLKSIADLEYVRVRKAQLCVLGGMDDVALSASAQPQDGNNLRPFRDASGEGGSQVGAITKTLTELVGLTTIAYGTTTEGSYCKKLVFVWFGYGIGGLAIACCLL